MYGLNQSFRRLSYLKNLNLSDCNLRNFPDMIGDLEAVGVLAETSFQSVLELMHEIV